MMCVEVSRRDCLIDRKFLTPGSHTNPYLTLSILKLDFGLISVVLVIDR